MNENITITVMCFNLLNLKVTPLYLQNKSQVPLNLAPACLSSSIPLPPVFPAIPNGVQLPAHTARPMSSPCFLPEMLVHVWRVPKPSLNELPRPYSPDIITKQGSAAWCTEKSMTLVFEKRKSDVLNAESTSRRQDAPLKSVSLIWGLDKCSGLGRTERHEVMLAGRVWLESFKTWTIMI